MSSHELGHLFNLNDEHKALLRNYWNAMFEYFSVNVDMSEGADEEEIKKKKLKIIQGKLHKRSRMDINNSASDHEDNSKESASKNNLNVDTSVNSSNNNFLSPLTAKKNGLMSAPVSDGNEKSPKAGKEEKRGSFSLFSRKSNTNLNKDNNSPSNSPPLLYNVPMYKGLAEIPLDDEHILNSMREEFFFMMTCDEPDSVALRFLRARKWNVNKAVKMTTNCLQWRIEWNVRALLENGEMGIDEDVFKSGKAFLYGVDKENRPISVVRVRFHNKNTVPLFESEKFTMFLMETGRLLIKPPIEMFTIIFDMTDFSMNNMVIN